MVLMEGTRFFMFLSLKTPVLPFYANVCPFIRFTSFNKSISIRN